MSNDSDLRQDLKHRSLGSDLRNGGKTECSARLSSADFLVKSGNLVGASGFEPAYAKASARQATDPSVPNRTVSTIVSQHSATSATRVASG
jgi:hypothetical protein